MRRLEIETGDGVTFSLPLAGPVSRFLALTVDWTVTMASVVFFSWGLGAVPGLSEDTKTALGVLAYFVIGMGYGVALEWFWGGRTLGKRAVGLRVADATGLRLAFSQVLIRNVLRSVDGLPLFYLVGGIAMLSGGKMQRLGDLAAGTVVLRAREAALPGLPGGGGARVNSMRVHRALGARLRQRVEPVAARAALDGLRRRDALEPGARLALFGEMAAGFRGMVEFPEEATMHLTDEQYCWNVVEILYGRG